MGCRARKPMAQEKEALNIAFLANPVASLIMPTITKDVAIIWWVNAATMALCYAYAYTKTPTAEEEVEAVDDSKEEGVGKVLLKALKALDYGSGQERGLRK